MKYIKHLGFSTIKRVLHETENTQTILLLQSFTITLSHPSYTERAARMGLCSHTWMLTHQSTHTLYCYAFFNEGKIIRLIRRKTKKKRKENRRERKKKQQSQKVKHNKNLKFLWKCSLTKHQQFFFFCNTDYLRISGKYQTIFSNFSKGMRTVVTLVCKISIICCIFLRYIFSISN